MSKAGVALCERVCELDLEEIVAKKRHAPYVTDREQSTWYKIATGDIRRWWEELFQKDRGSEPAPGWHSCELACGGVEG
jgi:hypothetical protein